HHEFGIKMGELVDERASNPELKKFAAKTVKKQREEVEKMTGWLEAWHDSAPDKEPVPEESQKKSKEQIERLGSLKGDKFDYAFLDIMTKHHQSGIDMFELVDDKTDREELEHFSKEGIAHQQKEIREMQAMHAYPEED